MINFVTIFDSRFLPQGLALYISLQRHIPVFKLWVICVDDDAFESLIKLGLPNIQGVKALDHVDKNLSELFYERSRREFCWTLTPFSHKIIFDIDQDIDQITYLDADTWFCGSPNAIFDEFASSRKALMITDHAYDKPYDQTEVSGRFCVQFIPVIRDRCDLVLDWWGGKCREWCSEIAANGKMGDQKYLDSWPNLFLDHVHVLKNLALIQAPWNGNRFDIHDAVLYHFQGLRFIDDSRIRISGYKISSRVRRHVYDPYFEDLYQSKLMLRSIGQVIEEQRKYQSFIQRVVLCFAGAIKTGRIPPMRYRKLSGSLVNDV